MDAPINKTDQASRFTIPESPKPVEQNSATGSTEEELNGSEYHEAAPEEEPKTWYPEDYYEILQISRSADLETIHRVYRMMAFRFHPDNTKTGNLERFLLLKQAYLVLSDPLQRAAYDAASPAPDTRPLPLFESKEFLYGVRGEMNRRLGVLSLLYHKRRLGEGTCGISVLDLEKRMAFPREYLTFTLWYLRSRGYITVEDNSDYALTGDGVDFVEANGLRNDAIRQLLTAGTGTETSSAQMTFDVAAGASAPTPVASWPTSQSRSERHHAWRRANGKWRRRGRGGQSSDAVGTRNCHLDS